MSKKIGRIGETNISNEGCVMKIIEYNNTNDIIVEFQEVYKYRLHTQYSNFKNGQCKNPFFDSVYGHGYLGVDVNDNMPKTKEFKDGKSVRTQEYQKWHDMLKRCFDNKLKGKYPTYKDVICCDKWLCFANFLKDFEVLKQEYSWGEDITLNLDKDILHKGNKIYNLGNCILVPDWINLLFIKNDVKRGEYPIGVGYHKRDKKISSSMSYQ